MAHSYIIGRSLEFEVRDSICEAILERMRNELKKSGVSQSALELATKWFDYWYSMPPGSKELKLEIPTQEAREALSKALAVIIPTLNPEGEQFRVAKQIETIFAE